MRGAPQTVAWRRRRHHPPRPVAARPHWTAARSGQGWASRPTLMAGGRWRSRTPAATAGPPPHPAAGTQILCPCHQPHPLPAQVPGTKEMSDEVLSCFTFTCLPCHVHILGYVRFPTNKAFSDGTARPNFSCTEECKDFHPAELACMVTEPDMNWVRRGASASQCASSEVATAEMSGPMLTPENLW